MHDRSSTTLPSREHDAAMPALVLDVLDRLDEVRYATETEAGADDKAPQTVHKTHQPWYPQISILCTVESKDVLCNVTRMMLHTR